MADCGSPLMIAVAPAGSRQGVMATDGRWVIRPEYETVARLEGEGASCFALAVVATVGGGIGRIACVDGGNVRYSAPRQFRCPDGEVCFLQEPTGWRRLDIRTLQAIGTSYADIGGIVQGHVTVRQGEHWGLMAKSGQVTVPAEFDEIASLADRSGQWQHLLKVRRDARWGVVAADGHVVLPVRYDAILELSGDALLAKTDSVVQLETLSGQPVLDPSPPWLQRIHALSDFSEGYWAAFTLDHELYFIDKRARTVHRVDPPPGSTWLDPDYGARMSDEIVGYEASGFTGLLRVRSPVPSNGVIHASVFAVVVDADGRLLPWLFDDDESSIPVAPGRYVVSLRGKCGVIDDRGRWVVPLEHDHCFEIESGVLILGDEDYPRSAGTIRVSPYADARQAQVYDPVRRWTAARRGEN